MTPAEFRSRLDGLGLTVDQLATRLGELGDSRPYATIRRNLYEIASPSRTAPAPWAIAVILTLLEREALRDIGLDGLMAEARLTPTDLAQCLRVSPDTVTKWARGRRVTPPAVLYWLGQLLNDPDRAPPHPPGWFDHANGPDPD